MESPFPGMDPYLELHWRSVRHRLITYAGDQLQSVLPGRFRVEVEERVFIAGDPAGTRSASPDAYIVEHRRAESPAASRASAVAEPVVIDLPDEPITETYLEIVDSASGQRVVTAIEFLSPSNKRPGDGNELYVRKQREYRAAAVSQVEIDLTRKGDRNLVFPMMHIPRQHRALYLACVRRGWQPGRIEAYPLALQVPLPAIGVPLDRSHADAALDLQGLVTQCYRNGRYEDIDYRADLHPPLPPEDSAWAEQRLQDCGRR